MFQLIQLLSVVPKSGVFALVNHETKTVYLAYSQNILFYIVNILFNDSNVKYRKLISDIEKLEFVLLYESNNKDDMLQQYSYYIDHYKSIDYKFYRKQSTVNYKIKTIFDGKYLLVCLITKGKKKKVMGVFDSKSDADKFIEKHYSGTYLKPVLCNNILTKQFLRGI